MASRPWRRDRTINGYFMMEASLYEIDPYALLNQKIQIYWEGEKEYFAGTVTQFNVDDWHHMVEYDDGDKAWELLVLQNVKIPKRPMSRPDCRADWPVPSSALMSSLGAILTEKAEKMEDGARSTTHGTSRSRDVKGSKTAKQLRELILKIMAKADRYEAMEQRQGALAPITTTMKSKTFQPAPQLCIR
ncbi:hypothetical protein CEUSTIGMA_g13444.t1 [Chlamydomonas eustigma]|uniref:Tudor domain-containing protein n=1 Tax=Chlamydomonas eustigma TaxID=1157962 RepID=A0A250XSU5_9CHLO|nr:hypothetical protein CEUSTIGMA_g13444.t1 [Chlamydomonas eustigma]|eukprot:GAX86029.1 hypothetical protein CEUSTIGMA_g13444.t1 [Chlamydomonas eustigma]